MGKQNQNYWNENISLIMKCLSIWFICSYGFSIIFGLTGTTKFFAIRDAIATLDSSSNLALTLSTIFVLAGFGYKISAVPFHFWTPDVYEGSPTPITAYLSVAPKAAGFALMIRFFNQVLVESDSKYDRMVCGC